jgi:toxin ParE1/3/4
VDRLRFNRRVSDDLAQALAWYDAISTELGDRFREAVNEAYNAIVSSPELSSFAFYDLDVRFYRIRRFPYLVLYRIEASMIQVIGVFHGTSDPEKWRHRVTAT